MGQIDPGHLSQALDICSIDKNEASMKLSMITRTATGTIGGYTVTKETTMKQIDTAQLDITACQAQAAEYHARGFQLRAGRRLHARTCRRTRPPGRLYPHRGLWCRHGRHDRNLRRHLGRRGHHGLRDERRHGKTPRPKARPTSCRVKLPSVLARRIRRPSAARSRASDRIRVRSAAAPVASTMPSRSPAMC